MDAVATLSAGAAAGGLHLGQCRIFFPRHHARRRHPHHRDGGDERLPQGAAGQDFRPQRPPPDPAAGAAADRLGGGDRAHFQGTRPHPCRADRRGPGARVLALQRLRRAGARRARRRSRQAPLRCQQYPPRHARGFDEGQGVAIGRRLADQLSLRAGDSVTLVAPRGAVTPMGTTPRIKSYKIAAVFEIGMSEYDSAFVFMPLSEAQAYFNRAGDVTAIEIYTDDPDHIDQFRQPVTDAAARPIYMIDWRQRNATFFNALQVERNVMFLILTLIVLVAALNIVSGLIMLVKDK